MDYMKLIKKILKQASQEQLKAIYYMIVGFLGDS